MTSGQRLKGGEETNSVDGLRWCIPDVTVLAHWSSREEASLATEDKTKGENKIILLIRAKLQIALEATVHQ